MSAPPPYGGEMFGGRYRRDFSSEGPPRLALTFASIPRGELPAALNGMPITEDVISAYRGHESLLRFRSLHSAPCYARFDAIRKCFVKGLAPHTDAECEALFEAYRPCSKDLKQRVEQRRRELEEEGRRRRASVVVKLEKPLEEQGGGGQTQT